MAEHDLAAVRRVAREFPGAVTLVDALSVLLLMLEGDDSAFDAAAVRWINRFTGERRGVALTEVHAAVEALDGLRRPMRAQRLRLLLVQPRCVLLNLLALTALGQAKMPSAGHTAASVGDDHIAHPGAGTAPSIQEGRGSTGTEAQP